MSFIGSVYDSLRLYDSMSKGESVKPDSLKSLCLLAHIDLQGLENVDIESLIGRIQQICPTKEALVYRCLGLEEWVTKGDGSEKAAQEMCKCFIEGRKVLNLSNTGITELPHCLQDFDFVEELDISSNDGLHLPNEREVWGIYPKNIKKLNISNTNIKLDGYHLYSLNKLEELHAGGPGQMIYKAEYSTLLGRLKILDLQGKRIDPNSLSWFERSLTNRNAKFLHDDPKKRVSDDEAGNTAKKRKTIPSHERLMGDFDAYEEEIRHYRDQERAEFKENMKRMTEEEIKRIRNDDLKLLGLHPDPTERDIRKAYKNIALQAHPDKIPRKEGESEAELQKRQDEATENFKKIQAAYFRLIPE